MKLNLTLEITGSDIAPKDRVETTESNYQTTNEKNTDSSEQIKYQRGAWCASAIVVTLVVIQLYPPAWNWISSQIHHNLIPTKTKIVFPLAETTPEKVKITDVPGSPRPGGRIHAGVDYAYTGKVVSALDGIISEAKPDSPVGGIIGVDSTYKSEKIKIRYVHLNRNSVRYLQVGQPVKAGGKIGLIKETFEGSTGPHSHIEVYKNGYLDWHPWNFLGGKER